MLAVSPSSTRPIALLWRNSSRDGSIESILDCQRVPASISITRPGAARHHLRRLQTGTHRDGPFTHPNGILSNRASGPPAVISDGHEHEQLHPILARASIECLPSGETTNKTQNPCARRVLNLMRKSRLCLRDGLKGGGTEMRSLSLVYRMYSPCFYVKNRMHFLFHPPESARILCRDP